MTRGPMMKEDKDVGRTGTKGRKKMEMGRNVTLVPRFFELIDHHKEKQVTCFFKQNNGRRTRGTEGGDASNILGGFAAGRGASWIGESV